ncbi:MAG TPA: hypothetical protein VEK34_13475 [Methylocella sp.]|nr:hypothetical protein [Methylocella sp.]
MEATIKAVDTMENDPGRNGRTLADVTWADVAVKYCKDLYELLYRRLSSDGTHTTLDSIDRVFDNDPATKNITGLKVGPDILGLVETLKAACLMFIWAAEPFALVYNQTDAQTRIEKMMERFKTLPPDEPSVTVVANFRS